MKPSSTQAVEQIKQARKRNGQTCPIIVHVVVHVVFVVVAYSVQVKEFLRNPLLVSTL
jgi:t-SNARE complex subunit (syntaxin)